MGQTLILSSLRRHLQSKSHTAQELTDEEKIEHYKLHLLERCSLNNKPK
jgi:hypothetical protein